MMELETYEIETSCMNPESQNEFVFETDHLALRGNKDYCTLLKYIFKLEAQKTKALQDIEELAEQEKKALDDPMSFVEDLKSNKITFPPRQVIDDMPNIDWNSYGISITENDEMKHNKDDIDLKVRGRKFSDSKPETFNQLWSCEEQKRLEELLEIYPEEQVEARRYKKIADALGTRTPVQVMSRIQKYFAKLVKAGLPVPGRIPKRSARERNKAIFYKKSTFFPQLHVPVKMEDQVYDEGKSNEGSSSAENQYGQKYVLELLKAAKEQRALDEMSPIYQINVMCVGCQKTGFLGARWTDNTGTDYCTDCIVKLLPSEKLVPVRKIL